MPNHPYLDRIYNYHRRDRTILHGTLPYSTDGTPFSDTNLFVPINIVWYWDTTTPEIHVRAIFSYFAPNGQIQTDTIDADTVVAPDRYMPVEEVSAWITDIMLERDGNAISNLGSEYLANIYDLQLFQEAFDGDLVDDLSPECILPIFFCHEDPSEEEIYVFCKFYQPLVTIGVIVAYLKWGTLRDTASVRAQLRTQAELLHGCLGTTGIEMLVSSEYLDKELPTFLQICIQSDIYRRGSATTLKMNVLLGLSMTMRELLMHNPQRAPS